MITLRHTTPTVLVFTLTSEFFRLLFNFHLQSIRHYTVSNWMSVSRFNWNVSTPLKEYKVLSELYACFSLLINISTIPLQLVIRSSKTVLRRYTIASDPSGVLARLHLLLLRNIPILKLLSKHLPFYECLVQSTNVDTQIIPHQVNRIGNGALAPTATQSRKKKLTSPQVSITP